MPFTSTVLVLTNLASVASFWTPPMMRPHITDRVLLSSAAAVRRCADPRAMASGDDIWTNQDDMALYKYISKRAQEFRCGPPQTVLEDMAEGAWVLIFNPGRKNEGVYTLQGPKAPSVLAFESMMDAQRFARDLGSSNFHTPVPMQWKRDQLTVFATAGHFEVSVVPIVRACQPTATRQHAPT